MVLETEQQILQNTCEILLEDIVPDFELHALILDPFGPGWKCYEEEINTRLHRSSSAFQQTVNGMKKAVEELQQRLAVDENGKTKFNGDRHSILEELKRSAREASFTVSFTLKKKDYSSILHRIISGNTALHTLASQSMALEPTRRSGSQVKFARLTRNLSQKMFTALQSAIKCKCSSHGLGLEIAPRQEKTIPGNEEHQGACARSIHFGIVVGRYEQRQTKHWEIFRIRLAEEPWEDRPLGSSRLLPAKNTLQGVEPLPRPKSPRRVKFASLLTGHTSDKKNLAVPGGTHNPQLSSICQNAANPPIPITDLCQLLEKSKGPASDCYGSIADASTKFNLYTRDGQLKDYTTVNLREILEERRRGPRHFEYPETLQVALALSLSILHYYNTPWLAKIVTTEHVAFLCEEKAPTVNVYNLDKPFLAKQVLTSSVLGASTEQRLITTRPVNFTLLSLGFLLIQIILGRTIEDFQIKDDTDLNYLLEKQVKASQLNGSGEMLIHGGPNYAAAVQWCLDNFFNGASLEDETFCSKFYSEVIARLEADTKHQSLNF